MAFEVKISASAEKDLVECLDFISRDSLVQAKKWFEEFESVLESLRELPACHALIPESKVIKRSLRAINHYSHRVVYEVDEAADLVYIIRVYHFARQPLKARDVK